MKPREHVQTIKTCSRSTAVRWWEPGKTQPTPPAPKPSPTQPKSTHDNPTQPNRTQFSIIALRSGVTSTISGRRRMGHGTRKVGHTGLERTFLFFVPSKVTTNIVPGSKSGLNEVSCRRQAGAHSPAAVYPPSPSVDNVNAASANYCQTHPHKVHIVPFSRLVPGRIPFGLALPSLLYPVFAMVPDTSSVSSPRVNS